jgi:hypothetical protein
MSKKKPLTAALFLSALFIVSPASALFAQRLGADAVLSGLTTLHPVFRYTEDGTPRPGGPEVRQLLSDVQGVLAGAGITIVGSAEFERLMGARNYPIGVLEMDVSMSGHPELDLKSYLLSLRIKQAVYLTRKPVVKFLGTTWESTDFGVAKDLTFVRGVARDTAGRFIQEWSAQNAK